MEDKKINKKLVIVSVLIATIITSIGVAFGYFVWNSTTNTDISFTVEGAVVQLDDGTDIKGANLMPVASYTSGGKDVVKKGIKIKLKDTVSDTVTVDFKLKINSIDSGLNHSSFKYNLVNASGTSVKSGNFSTSKAGDSINLLTLSTTDGSLTTSLTSYTLYIYIDGASGDNPSSMMNQSFDFSLDVTGSNSNVEYILATKRVESLDDGTTGDSGSGVYKVEHSAIPAESSATGSEIPAVTDYRYYGASPNNYICLDMEGQSTCPDRGLFRIIGSIYEENAGTNLIKVIKATTLTDGTTSTFCWDCNVVNDYINAKNVWSSTTSGTSSGATLMKLLNGVYLTRESSSYFKNKKEITINFLNNGLTDVAQSFMNTVDGNKNSRYYLGGYSSNEVKTNVMYLAERGKTTSSESALYWDGMVGLMYPSDYGYAAGNECVTGTDLKKYNKGCQAKDWIYNSSEYQWTITPMLSGINYAYRIGVTGLVVEEIIYIDMSLSPVFYLTSTTSITSGSGTQDDPYLVS